MKNTKLHLLALSAVLACHLTVGPKSVKKVEESPGNPILWSTNLRQAHIEKAKCAIYCWLACCETFFFLIGKCMILTVFVTSFRDHNKCFERAEATQNKVPQASFLLFCTAVGQVTQKKYVILFRFVIERLYQDILSIGDSRPKQIPVSTVYCLLKVKMTILTCLRNVFLILFSNNVMKLEQENEIYMTLCLIKTKADRFKQGR